MQFGDILKSLRLEQNITQTELAKRANLAPSCIAMIETNKREPSANTLIEISKALNVSTDYLLGLEDDFGIKKTDSPILPIYSKEEQQIIEDYRALTPALKKMIKDTLKTFTTSEEVKKRKGEN